MTTSFVAPPGVETSTRPAWGTCVCDHGVSDHGRRQVPSGGGRAEMTGCRIDGCDCERWKASDGSGWPYNGPAGVPFAGA